MNGSFNFRGSSFTQILADALQNSRDQFPRGFIIEDDSPEPEHADGRVTVDPMHSTSSGSSAPSAPSARDINTIRTKATAETAENRKNNEWIAFFAFFATFCEQPFLSGNAIFCELMMLAESQYRDGTASYIREILHNKIAKDAKEPRKKLHYSSAIDGFAHRM